MCFALNLRLRGNNFIHRGSERRKTNLLFVMIDLAPGGSERVVLDLARNLDRALFNVYVAFFSGGALHSAFSEVCKQLFQVSKKHGFDPAAMLQISKIIHSNSVDVINAHHYMPFVYSYPGSKIFHKRRLIYTEHSVPEVEAIASNKHKHFCNVMFSNTDKVIGVSWEIADSFRKVFPIHSRKFANIANGIDIDRFATQVDRDEVRLQWGIRPEHFLIGTVANFRKVKNHNCLIRAFDKLSTIYPHTRLVLVGRGYPEDSENSEEEVRHLIEMYNLQDRVLLTGYREDIASILHMFDVFCLPSSSEGLPVSILEAMAARVPVVGSNVRGIKEVILPEETGLLFPSDDQSGLVQALERLIKDRGLGDRLRENAYVYISKTHGLGQWISAYERLFSG